jgi:hypothetical protein
MKVKQIIKELEAIKRYVVNLECYPSNKLALDTWVIGQIDLILDEHFKKKSSVIEDEDKESMLDEQIESNYRRDLQ